MKELRCPNCGSMFTVDEADYASIVNQVKNAEFEEELCRRINEMKGRQDAEQKAKDAEARESLGKKLSAKEQELLAKGFSSSDINSAALECEVDFEQLLTELINKLTKSSGIDFSDRNEVLKFKAKLSRYGYGFDTINAVLSHMGDNTDDCYGDE